jgi:hypothetical protein
MKGGEQRTDRDARGVSDDGQQPGGSPAAGWIEHLGRPAVGALVTAAGWRIETESGPAAGHFRVRSPEGEVVLSVVLTERGPVLRFESASICLAAADEVAIECERFVVRARADASIEAGDVCVRTMRGHAVVEARRDVYLRAGVPPGKPPTDGGQGGCSPPRKRP